MKCEIYTLVGVLFGCVFVSVYVNVIHNEHERRYEAVREQVDRASDRTIGLVGRVEAAVSGMEACWSENRALFERDRVQRAELSRVEDEYVAAMEKLCEADPLCGLR